MSKQIADQASTAPGDTPPPATPTTFTLSATNGSSVAGVSYFSVFPPPLKSPAVSVQVLTALISNVTRSGQGETTLTWNGGSGALALLAIAGNGKGDPATAEKTPVTLGGKATVTFANGTYAIAVSTGGPANSVEVDFDLSVPPASLVGLVVGPAAILLAPPAGMGPLILEPDLSRTVTVVFGTACTYPPPAISDVDQGSTVMFASSGASAASAQIKVGPDNLIVQTG